MLPGMQNRAEVRTEKSHIGVMEGRTLGDWRADLEGRGARVANMASPPDGRDVMFGRETLEALDEVLGGVEGGRTTAAEALERLLAAQIALRNSRRLAAAMRSSRLLCVRTLDAFDFSFQPTIKREQIDALHELDFLERRGRQDAPGDQLGNHRGRERPQ